MWFDWSTVDMLWRFGFKPDKVEAPFLPIGSIWLMKFVGSMRIGLELSAPILIGLKLAFC